MRATWIDLARQAGHMRARHSEAQAHADRTLATIRNNLHATPAALKALCDLADQASMHAIATGTNAIAAHNAAIKAYNDDNRVTRRLVWR